MDSSDIYQISQRVYLEYRRTRRVAKTLRRNAKNAIRGALNLKISYIFGEKRHFLDRAKTMERRAQDI